jgi:hypothetical protein
MKPILFSFLLAILLCQTNTTSAQTTEPTNYIVFGYHKVNPGMRDDFLKLAKAWKKIVAYKKKSGMQDDWSISRVVMPAGASSEYDYVTRHSFIGEEQLAGYLGKPFLPENWETLLTLDEIKLVLRAEEIRTYVKGEVWSTLDRTVAADIGKSTVVVFNYFKQPVGKTQADHIKMETDIWKPVHDARVKDGTMKGWIMLGLQMPFGSSQPYDMATIDVYTDMKQMLAPWFDAYFKKVHPGKNIDELMKQTDAATNLVKGEVRIIFDRLDW